MNEVTKAIREILGYDVDELELGTRCYLSTLIDSYTPGYRLSSLKIKLNTSRTYMRQTSGKRGKRYQMVLGMKNVMVHVMDGLAEYPSLRDRVYQYDKCGRDSTGVHSQHYKGLRCWNAVILHEFSHMFCEVHECGKGHDDVFLNTYNNLLKKHATVDTSILSVLNEHDLVRVSNGCDDYRLRIFKQTEEWNN